MAQRSSSAPLDHSHDDHRDGNNDNASMPSTLYARCMNGVSSTLQAHRLRQAAEDDVRTLMNRVKKLKLEEQRAKQEIDHLRNKTKEVEHSKKRSNENISERRELKDVVDYGRRKEAALIALNKEKQAKAVWSSKQKVMLDRREAVINLRKQKEINECRILIQKEESRDKNAKQRETIRQLHSMAKTRKEREAEMKREEVREYYDRRIEEDLLARENNERMAAQLVAQEAELLYRLKRLHQEKHKSLHGLADVVDPSRRSESANNGEDNSEYSPQYRTATPQDSRPQSRQSLPPINN